MTEPSLVIGEGRVTPIRDGTLELDIGLFSGLPESAKQTPSPISAAANAFLYQSPDVTLLIDAGAGGMLPGTGDLMAGLADLGVNPDDIDIIFCTHLHPDHIGGLIADGSPVFDRATLWVHADELGFWGNTEIQKGAPQEAQAFFVAAQAVISGYQGRIRSFVGATALMADVTTVPLPGHTPGHTGLQIGKGDDGLFVWGDIVHAEELQLANPSASIAFDVDPNQAAKTRIDVLKRVTEHQIRVAGGHLSTPGFGHIRKSGSGYIFVPETTP